jgi:flagellar biosynthesis GTPase FlhF
MKTFILVFILAAFSIGFRAEEFLQRKVDDVLSQVGIEPSEAREHIWRSFSGGYISYPSVATLKKIAVGDRAGVVQAVAELARAESKSPAFLKKYLEYRESTKPKPPEPPKPVSKLREEMKEEHKRSLRNLEEQIAKMPADQRAMMQEVMASMRETGKLLDDPENPMFSPEMDKLNRQFYEEELSRYREELAEWEQRYPPTPNAMIKSWLEQFLDVSKDVDFSAKLIPGEGGKMVFANPAYEQRSPAWKMCFRAGKETVQAARMAAAEWLKEL